MMLFPVKKGGKIEWLQTSRQVRLTKPSGEAILWPEEGSDEHQDNLFITTEEDFAAFAVIFASAFKVGLVPLHNTHVPTFLLT
jgi:hypothetical protein